MINTAAVVISKTLIDSNAPMIIKQTPADFVCALPYVVVSYVQPQFVMGDFNSLEMAEHYCQCKQLPIKCIELEGWSLTLQSSEHGFLDYDATGNTTLRRACVPISIRNGESFNVYHSESSKSGAVWLGSLSKSLSAWLADEPVSGGVEVLPTPVQDSYIRT